METTVQKTLVNSNKELEQLSSGAIQIIAEYAFQNPDSINGPFGTLKLTLSEDNAIGEIKISTLWVMGSTTLLNFNGPSHFNPSTGYTTINAASKGTISIVPNPPKPISAEVSITLNPGLKEGELTVEGFFSNFKIKATHIQYLSNN
ncbi:conserved protein of unknown function [Tenacibaculum sp. 190130A14a]|uniref:DUF1842 domain-containing protein n=1 Tax=Tenacibaculum polynesiense TaxID=3137857 RepID=A0ABP1EWC2_9FLAO